MNMMKPNTKKNPTEIGKSKMLSNSRIFFGLLMFLISFVLTLSFISYLMKWQEDQSQAGMMLDRSIKSSNLFGKIGDWLGNIFVFESIGIAAFIIAFLFLVFGLLIFKKNYFKPWKTFGHSLFFICWLPIFMGAITKGQGALSGVYGFQIMDFLSSFIGKFGLWVFIISSIALYFILEFNLRPSAIKAKINTINEKAKSLIPTREIADNEEIIDEEEKDITPKPEEEDFSFTEKPLKVKEQSKFQSIIEETPIIEKPILEEMNETPTPKKEDFIIENPTSNNIIVEEEKPLDFEIEITTNEEETTIPIVETPEQKSQKLVEEIGLYDHKLDLPHYQMPSVDLLKDYGNNEEISINKEELEENKNKIVAVLKNFNVGIAQIKATIGPTVTLYEIVPDTGVRISQIKRLQDDIALSLSALGIRIIAPMPGKGTVGIEVPRKNTSMVSMRSVIASKKFQETDMDLPVVFGRTISNEIFMADLAKMPHLLMAGATGQGKSVGINAILTSLLYKKHPSELKFVMVDPKKVELSLYAKIERHYLAKLPDAEDAIITDNNKVINTLNSLCVEMDTRYELLKNAYCKNLKEYNKKFSERQLNPENGHRYLPYIVLVVDEFADLIMTAGKEVEHPIARLAQLARAVGIHLIVATQRPSVNVITGMIKANFPARAAFRVMTGVDSKTILDTTGAEQLVGKGDMLYLNGNEILRLQCAFVDTPEVERIAEFIGEQRGYSSAFLLPEYTSDEGGSTATFDPNERDSMFEEAARVIVSSQQGSTSMLQRQLKLGYNRAGRIMDQLEAAGIVGAFNGAKAREVLISDLNYLEQFLENLKK